MSEVFGSGYSGAYDLIYHDKDYQAECDVLEAIFADYGSRPAGSILDLCCGTGNHAIPLARRGYEVTGVDISPHMLENARAKSQDVRLEFVESDARTLTLNRTFDAVLMMFATLGYQSQDQDVIAVLDVVRRHLHPQGLFVFDVWYAPAVLHVGPTQKVRHFPTPGGELSRTSIARILPGTSICNVEIHLVEMSGGNQVSEVHEVHPMRFFDRPQLENFLKLAGMNLLELCAFPEPGHPPDEDTWNVLGIAAPIGDR